VRCKPQRLHGSQNPCDLLAFRRMVAALGPDVPGERLDAGHIALVVKAQTAENRVKFIVTQRLDHCSGLEGARLCDRLRPDLSHGVAIQREPFGFISFCAELGDDRRRRLMKAGIVH
jgi:hypothetical protein